MDTNPDIADKAVNKTLLTKLDTISERVEEINALLADPDVIGDQNKFRSLSQEYAQIQPVSECYADYQSTLGDIEEAEKMLQAWYDARPEVRDWQAKKKDIAHLGSES